MNTNTLIAIIAVIVIAGGGLFLLTRDGSDTLPPENTNTEENGNVNNSTSTPPSSTNTNTNTGSSNNNEQTSSTETVITYTASGYSPKTVTINVGDSVRFVNNSDSGMWTASAVHPTHSVYPVKDDADCLGSSFDACEATAPGESWTYTFTEAGDWGFHNHVNASHTGTVTVE